MRKCKYIRVWSPILEEFFSTYEHCDRCNYGKYDYKKNKYYCWLKKVEKKELKIKQKLCDIPF